MAVLDLSPRAAAPRAEGSSPVSDAAASTEEPALPVLRQERLFASLGGFLRWVERVSANGAGIVELRHPGSVRPLGVVMAERGRICWASVSDGCSTLTGRIRDEIGIDADELSRVFVKCKMAGRPLGEALVEEGLLEADTFRSLLLHHVSGVLGRLVRHAVDGELDWSPFQPKPDDSYYPAFTFRPAELVASLLEEDLEFGLPVAPSPEPFRLLCAESSGAAHFLLGSDGRPILLLEVSDSLAGLSLDELCRLATDACSLLCLDGWKEAGEEPRMVSLSRGSEILLVCRMGRHLLVGEVVDQALFVQTFSSLRRAVLEAEDAGG